LVVKYGAQNDTGSDRPHAAGVNAEGGLDLGLFGSRDKVFSKSRGEALGEVALICVVGNPSGEVVLIIVSVGGTNGFWTFAEIRTTNPKEIHPLEAKATEADVRDFGETH